MDQLLLRYVRYNVTSGSLAIALTFLKRSLSESVTLPHLILKFGLTYFIEITKRIDCLQSVFIALMNTCYELLVLCVSPKQS
jgi:hypothetical protein